MRPLEITIGISPADIAPWNGAEVPIRFVITETAVLVRFPHPPNLNSDILERLRTEFSDIAPLLANQSREILWFLLNTKEGQASRQDLIDNVWTPDTTPTWSTVRKAVHTLNNKLLKINFSYIVRGNRTGIFRLIPVTVPIEANGT